MVENPMWVLEKQKKCLNSDKVHAMFGAYYSSVTGAASQVSERAGIPWVNGESTSPKLNYKRI